MSSDEFKEAFEAARERIFPPQRMHVFDLRPGDVLFDPILGSYMFVCRGMHPIWPHLQAVVWCDSGGNLSIDALSLRQELSQKVTNRGESEEERGKRFRLWYLERKK